jgi:hypothetical protein
MHRGLDKCVYECILVANPKGSIKPDFCDDVCLPPPAKPKRNGLQQKKRKEKRDRPEKLQRPQVCIRCNHTGHNKKNTRKCL